MNTYIKSRERYIKESKLIKGDNINFSWHDLERDIKIIEDMLRSSGLDFTTTRYEVETKTSSELSDIEDPAQIVIRIGDFESVINFQYSEIDESDLRGIDEDEKEEILNLMDDGYVYDTSEFHIRFFTNKEDLESKHKVPNNIDISRTDDLKKLLNILIAKSKAIEDLSNITKRVNENTDLSQINDDLYKFIYELEKRNIEYNLDRDPSLDDLTKEIENNIPIIITFLYLGWDFIVTFELWNPTNYNIKLRYNKGDEQRKKGIVGAGLIGEILDDLYQEDHDKQSDLIKKVNESNSTSFRLDDISEDLKIIESFLESNKIKYRVSIDEDLMNKNLMYSRNFLHDDSTPVAVFFEYLGEKFSLQFLLNEFDEDNLEYFTEEDKEEYESILNDGHTYDSQSYLIYVFCDNTDIIYDGHDINNINELEEVLNDLKKKVSAKLKSDLAISVNERKNTFVNFKSFDLEKWYDKLNKQFFSGKLKKVPLRWNQAEKELGVVKWDEKSKEVDHLGISQKFKLTQEELLSVLAHEMIHVWQVQNNKTDGHGKNFEKEMERINDKSKWGIQVLPKQPMGHLKMNNPDLNRDYGFIIFKHAKNKFKICIFDQNKVDVKNLLTIAKQNSKKPVEYEVRLTENGIVKQYDKESNNKNLITYDLDELTFNTLMNDSKKVSGGTIK